MIERLEFPKVALIPAGRDFSDEGNPVVVLGKERAVIDCGCCCWVGIRTDNTEAASVAFACSTEHLPQMELFQQKIKDTLSLIEEGYDDGGRELVVVAEELLREAHAEVS